MFGRHIANAVTISRMLMATAIVVFLSHPQLVFWLLALGVTTDIADGPLARHFGSCTPLGKRLDRAADTILFTVAVWSLPFTGWLPWWFIPASAVGCAAGVVIIGKVGLKVSRYLGWAMTLAFFSLYCLAGRDFLVRAYGWHAYDWLAVAVALAFLAWSYRRRMVWYLRKKVVPARGAGQ